MSKTFKEIDTESDIEKTLTKFGSSLGIVFTKEDLKRFDLMYGDKICLNNAEIIKEKK